MSEKEKKEIAERLLTRIATGLYFIEFNYLERYSTPDPAFIRNIYILLSFYTELLLKTIFIIKGTFSSIAELDEELKRLGHNIEAIGQRIDKRELHSFGIRDIRLENNEYVIETDEGNFHVKDFTNIRYDFLDGRVRMVAKNEHEAFKKQIEIMLKINEILKPLAF